ncbi:hypothetical protein TYRP_007741 [Tyrophagus putrescentiae]|nr:hypothetical protein TYRP_007741 [Tyrophagus putrescentiae]
MYDKINAKDYSYLLPTQVLPVAGENALMGRGGDQHSRILVVDLLRRHSRRLVAPKVGGRAELLAVADEVLLRGVVGAAVRLHAPVAGQRRLVALGDEGGEGLGRGAIRSRQLAHCSLHNGQLFGGGGDRSLCHLEDGLRQLAGHRLGRLLSGGDDCLRRGGQSLLEPALNRLQLGASAQHQLKLLTGAVVQRRVEGVHPRLVRLNLLRQIVRLEVERGGELAGHRRLLLQAVGNVCHRAVDSAHQRLNLTGDGLHSGQLLLRLLQLGTCVRLERLLKRSNGGHVHPVRLIPTAHLRHDLRLEPPLRLQTVAHETAEEGGRLRHPPHRRPQTGLLHLLLNGGAEVGERLLRTLHTAHHQQVVRLEGGEQLAGEGVHAALNGGADGAQLATGLLDLPALRRNCPLHRLVALLNRIGNVHAHLLNCVNLREESLVVVGGLVRHLQNALRLSGEQLLGALVRLHQHPLILYLNSGSLQRVARQGQVVVELGELRLQPTQRLVFHAQAGGRLGEEFAPLGHLLLQLHDLRLTQLQIRLLRLERRLHRGVILRVHVDALLVAGRLQVAAEAVNLQHVLGDRLLLAHAKVHLRLVGDLLGALRVLQRTQRVLEVIQARADGGDDGGLGLAAERVLQQTGQLRVAVGNVARFLHQQRDDAAQRQQALVDVGRLAGALLHGARAADVLAAGQVDQVQLADLEDLLAVHQHLLDVHGDGEDAVRAAAAGVHQRGRRLPLDAALLQNLEDLVLGGDGHLHQAADDHRALPLGVIVDAQLVRVGERTEQVVGVLVVQLQERDANGVLGVLAGQVVDQLVDGAGDHAAGRVLVPADVQVGAVAHHGEGLPGARLAVGEDSAVVALDHLVHQRHHHRAVDVHLLGVGVEDAVKGVDLVLRRVANGPLLGGQLQLAALLALVQRPRAHKDLDVLVLLGHPGGGGGGGGRGGG